jgi:nitrite reductase (NADH) small subunit
MNEWITIGKLDDLPPRGARVVRTRDGDIAVFRTATDQLFALRDRCPHKGGPLSEGMVYGERVACPLHNWTIDLASGDAVAPDHGCTRRYPVRCVGDEVQIGLTHLVQA